MKDPKGFTLVELAIALMVIGLLIGGILKGQELIENGKVTATIRQLESYQSAVSMFESGYDALPGDIKDPGERIPDCGSALCNIPGNGNWKISYKFNYVGGDDDPETEQYNFFSHMAKAGYLKYPEGAASIPSSGNEEQWSLVSPSLPISNIKLTLAYRNSVKTWNGTNPSPQGHYFQSLIFGSAPDIRRFSGKQMFAMDEKIDDGRPQTGMLKGGQCAAGNWSSNQYDMTKKCDLELQARF